MAVRLGRSQRSGGGPHRIRQDPCGVPVGPRQARDDPQALVHPGPLGGMPALRDEALAVAVRFNPTIFRLRRRTPTLRSMRSG